MQFLRLPLKYRLLIPLIVVLLAVLIYPLIFSFWVSLHDYRLTALHEVQFVGLANYIGLSGKMSYWNALRNTLIFVFLAVGLQTIIGFGLALLLHRPSRFRNFFRAVLLTPMFITPIAVGLMFRFMLNLQVGVLPYLLDKVGVTIDWFSPRLALFSIILIDVWQWTPFMLLLLLAGLESLPVEPFEAARVDGASAWSTFWKVTLPLMRPVLIMALIIRMLDAFKVFEYIYAITQGGPGERTETILWHIYKVGFRFFRMSEAASMAYVLVLVTLVLVVALYYNMKRGEYRP
ncbi:MAG: Lactose transport system permease protein LacF [Firmicutes bacterium]|nr:Lactose transport system permease protein LacF [Bacillota bacterium]